MKLQTQTAVVLSAIDYLIKTQSLSPEDIRALIKKTLKEGEQA